MRVLQINVVGDSGSTGRIVRAIQSALETRGHEGKIACGRAVPEDALAVGSRFGILWHVALTRLADRHGFGSRRATRTLLRRVEDFRPDILHLHNLHGYYLHVGELFRWLKEAGIPAVWTLHDCWAFTGHCAYFDYAACGRWLEGCHDCPQRRAYPASLLADRSAANWRDKRKLFTDGRITLVSPSCWLAELAEASFLGGYPCRVLPNGVDLSLFRPCGERDNVRRRLGVPPGGRLYLAAANVWEPRKGLSFLKQSLSLLEEGERLAVVGADPRELPAPAVCLPRVDRAEELAVLYSSADVFLNPTLEDNLPTVNLEALACGTPVAAFASGGCPETVDGQTGRVCDPGDANALLAAARELAAGGEAVRWACVERARRLYDAEKQAAAYVELYEELLMKG